MKSLWRINDYNMESVKSVINCYNEFKKKELGWGVWDFFFYRKKSKLRLFYENTSWKGYVTGEVFPMIQKIVKLTEKAIIPDANTAI